MSTQADPAQSGDADGILASQPAVVAQTVGSRPRPRRAARSVISTRSLTLSFGQRAILSDINTDIRRGAVTALIGPTGSGKTTLLRTFNRMNDKVTGYRHAGDVLMDGRSIWSPGVELMTLRRKVGMLFQRPNPFPMSIMENVTAGHSRTSNGQP